MAEESPYWRAFRPIRLRIGWWKWEYLPRHAAYKYEYFDGKAWISPRPRPVDMVLKLDDWAGPRPPRPYDAVSHRTIRIRQIQNGDWDRLLGAFNSAFSTEEPFKSLSGPRARKVAKACLDFTRRGDDGPIVHPACLLAETADDDMPPIVLGAAMVTDVRPPTLIERLQQFAPGIKSVPHLTWLFVNRLHGRHGIATELVDRVVKALRNAGHTLLASSTMLGSDASLLWHWKNGFSLLDQSFSERVNVVDG